MAGGSAFTLAIYLPSFFAFVPLILLPIIVKLLLLGSPFYIGLGISTGMFLLVIIAFNLKINKSLTSSMTLRFENVELIAQLQQQKEEAERANQAKSKFLAAASHDLRQPLYALGLFTSVLDETIKYPKVKKVVEQIHTAVNTLTSLFDKLLDISQLDAGGVVVEKSHFSLNTLFAKLISSYSTEAQSKNLTIHWPSNSLSVYSEPKLLEQILRNYLSNAIKYTPQGEINVACELVNNAASNAASNAMVRIEVSDTGLGIKEENISELYEEFYQIDNPERDREKGLGLGLAIVKRTAKLLGHEIDVSSEQGKGSRFSILVEASQENASVLNIEADESNNEQIVSATSTLIVVIDDEETIRLGLKQILQLWGYRVIIAQDQDHALLQLKESQQIPDVIISDYRLREGKTGVDAIKAIQIACKKTIPALIITGDIETERLVDINSHHLPVLFKPVPPVKLRSFLRSLS
jgi:signal transduction histidine kinase/CheY-like chemotaxis protein